MDRIVVLGGSGFVGQEVVAELGGPATALRARESYIGLDARDFNDLRVKLGLWTPEVVVNCVGLADVDRAEIEPGEADSLNRGVVENLVRLQTDMAFRLVHISTDYVFDGVQGGYTEQDAPRPINEYGRSKLRGEEAALRSQDSLVIRISSPYGAGFGARKPQFFRYVMESLRSGKSVRALTDQRVTATYLPDLARAIVTLIERSARGLVHVGSEEPLTRFEFAQKIAGVVNANPGLVHSGLRSDMTQWKAPRPGDTSLDVSRSKTLGVSYTPVEVALTRLCAA